LPSFIGTYSNLVRVQSQDNLFSGTIPDSFQNLARLTVFNMSNNHLTGSLPNWINNWTSVQHIRMAFNSLSSSIPESIGLLPNLLTLYLSSLIEMSGSLN
jgi:Leucine-rich repeat (LRR) protein